MSSKFECKCAGGKVEVTNDFEIENARLIYYAHFKRESDDGLMIEKTYNWKVTGIVSTGHSCKVLVEEMVDSEFFHTSLKLVELNDELEELSKATIPCSNQFCSAMTEDSIYAVEYVVASTTFEDSPNWWDIAQDIRCHQIGLDLHVKSEFLVEDLPEEDFGGVICSVDSIEPQGDKMILNCTYIPSDELNEFARKEHIDYDEHKFPITLIADFSASTLFERKQ